MLGRTYLFWAVDARQNLLVPELVDAGQILLVFVPEDAGQDLLYLSL